MKTILVAVDFSDATANIFDTVKTLAAAMGSRVVLLHVRQADPLTEAQLTMSPGSFIPTPPTIVHAENVAKAQLHLDELKTRFTGLPFEVTTEQREGVPSEIITQACADVGAEMIIMGSHGHGAVYHLLVGSVTDGVLKNAKCPVLIVPSPRAR